MYHSFTPIFQFSCFILMSKKMAILLLKSYCHGRKKKYLGSHAWLIIFENLPPFSPGSESKLCLKPMSFRQIMSLSQAAEEIQSITAVPMHYIIYTWNLIGQPFYTNGWLSIGWWCQIFKQKKGKCLEITISIHLKLVGFGVPGVFFYTPQVFQGLFPFFAHVWNIYSLWPICTEAQQSFSRKKIL